MLQNTLFLHLHIICTFINFPTILVTPLDFPLRTRNSCFWGQIWIWRRDKCRRGPGQAVKERDEA